MEGWGLAWGWVGTRRSAWLRRIARYAPGHLAAHAFILKEGCICVSVCGLKLTGGAAGQPVAHLAAHTVSAPELRAWTETVTDLPQ